MKTVELKQNGKYAEVYIDGVEIEDVVEINISRKGGGPTLLEMKAWVTSDVKAGI
jgi:hypothetical protein